MLLSESAGIIVLLSCESADLSCESAGSSPSGGQKAWWPVAGNPRIEVDLPVPGGPFLEACRIGVEVPHERALRADPVIRVMLDSDRSKIIFIWVVFFYNKKIFGTALPHWVYFKIVGLRGATRGGFVW